MINNHLQELKNRWRSEKFAWGTGNECFLGMGNFVRDVTGHDPVAEWRGKYKDEKTAREFIDRFGVLKEMSAGMQPFQLIEPDQMQTGDVAVVDIAGDEICAVFDGDYFLMKTPNGMFQKKKMKVLKAWTLKTLQ